jgi:hypothetical protein
MCAWAHVLVCLHKMLAGTVCTLCRHFLLAVAQLQLRGLCLGKHNAGTAARHLTDVTGEPLAALLCACCNRMHVWHVQCAQLHAFQDRPYLNI